MSGMWAAHRKANGMAIAGLVLGIIFLLIGFLFWAAMARRLGARPGMAQP